jgi:hypothetical protein
MPLDETAVATVAGYKLGAVVLGVTVTRSVATAGPKLAASLKEAATRALNKIGCGSGCVHGTHVHTAFQQEVRALGYRNLQTEVSYLAGQRVRRGEAGSVRVDVVVLGPDGRTPVAVYDLKTGSRGLTEARIREIRDALRDDDIPVHEVRP